MKKDQSKPQMRVTDTTTDLNDIGLEPPKIYSDTQAYRNRQKEARQNAPKKKKQPRRQQNLTRQEQRALESKKRKKKNRLRKAVLWTVFLVVILGAGIVLSLTMFFNITEIRVTGNERYTAEEILSQCPIDEGENLFMSDTKNASALLERNLPYIYRAELKRKLPDKLVINVTETQPTYSLQMDDGTFLLLDDNFKVLEADAEEGEGILITSAEVAVANVGQPVELAEENVMSSLLLMAQLIKDNQFTEFTGMYSYGLTENYLVYDNRIVFRLGTTDELEKKVFQGLATCEKLNESSPNVEGELNINGGKEIYFTEK